MNSSDEVPVTPREAATILVLREPFEVLMVQRNPALRFMGGFWVFPGGKVEDSDADVAATAHRELFEETAITLAPDAELVIFARWITPVSLPVRFDTWFFLASAAGATGLDDPQVDGSEILAARWVTPSEALTDGSEMAFPTRKQLEALAAFDDIDALLADARGRTIEAVLPEIARDAQSIKVDGRSEPFVPEQP